MRQQLRVAIFFRKMNLLINTLALFLLWATYSCSPSAAPQSAFAPAKLAVTYIANEGVLISSGDKQVLIDGLHRKYNPDYAFPPEALLKSLESAQPPYDRLRLILVSHLHLDHFHPVSVGLHLQNNKAAVLVSSDQIADGIKEGFDAYGEIEPRVRRVAYEWKKRVVINANGIDIKVLGLRHGGPQFGWVQNLGYVVSLNGRKILHIGDADMTQENFSTFNLAQEGIDVAFIPYWFFFSSDGRSIVREQIRPKYVVAVHIPPAEAEEVSKQIKAVYPEAIMLTKILETKAF